MAAKTSKRKRRVTKDNSFTLAVAVFRERIQGLPPEDKQDLLALMPDLFVDDEEASRSAQKAVDEILNHATGRVVRMPGLEDSGELTNWLDFVRGRIRRSRLAAGMTQEQLAARAGLTQEHISKLETAQHSPTAMTLRKIARALKVPVCSFDPSAENEPDEE